MNRTRLSASLLLIATVLAGLLLGACGPTPTAAPQPTNAPVPTSPPTQQPAGITVVDALGRTVQFSEPPSRIVLAGKSVLTMVDTLYLFPEAKDRLVGLVVGKQKPGDFLQYVDPTFNAKTALEVEAGPEQIAPLAPDVVLLRSFMAADLGKALEELAIPVVYLDLETSEQYFRDVAILGQLLGNEARAEEIQGFYQSRLDQLDQALGEMADSEKPRVLLLQYSNQGGELALNVPSASWLQTTQAELAGSTPVWKEAAQAGGWTVVNFEQIAAWDPDQIYVISYGPDSDKVVDELAADAKWQSLRAVQNGQIYGFAGDYYSWDQPDPRWILGVTWLAGKVHADRTVSVDMMEEISAFFGQMYGLGEATIQEQIVPMLKGDVQ